MRRVSPTWAGSAGTLAAVALAWASCGGPSIGGNPDANPDTDADESDADVTNGKGLCESRQGSRITRNYIEPEAGARQELDIVDTELEEPCVFSREADGSFTCYPKNFGGTIFFQDAACTTAIVGVAVGTTPKTFARARRFSDGGCFLATHFRRIGQPSAVAGGQGVFRQDDTGTCSATIAPNRDYYLAGAELPISSFVTATRGEVSPSGRLTTATFEGADGSSMCDFEGGIFDSTLEHDCLPALGDDSELHCMPVAGPATNVFTNAGCTEETSVAIVDRCVEDPPAYVLSTGALTCGDVSTSVRGVSTEALAQRFENIDDVCVADSGTDRFFPVGDEVPASEFVSLNLETEESNGRLSRKLLKDAGGFESFGGLWHDSNLGVDCRFSKAVDGSLRCLPLTRTTQTFFADAGCTIPIQLAEIDGCQDDLEHFAVTGAQGTRILSAAPHTDPVFIDSAGPCEPASGSFLVPGFELAPSSFVEGIVSEL